VNPLILTFQIREKGYRQPAIFFEMPAKVIEMIPLTLAMVCKKMQRKPVPHRRKPRKRRKRLLCSLCLLLFNCDNCVELSPIPGSRGILLEETGSCRS
jgi:hypothetical protein